MKNTDIHVAVFPIGSIVKFSKEKLKRSDGSNEYYRMIWSLVRQKHIRKVSIIQKSDWPMLNEVQKEEFDPRGVIWDVYSELNLRTPQGVTGKTQKEKCYYLWDALKDIEDKPDFGIGFPAQGFAMINVPNFLPQLRDPSKLCSALNMTVRYAGPIVHYINMSKLPWYMIATDPRYCQTNYKRRDVANTPLEVLAQFNDTIDFTSIPDYENYKLHDEETVKKIAVTYTGVEKMNLIGERAVAPDNNARTNKFAVVAMQSSYGKGNMKDYRYNILKEWVFKQDVNQEAKVYGKWAEAFTEGYPQFKGFLPSQEIDELFENTRYTLVIPIRANWVTSKYAEMLRVGVVPFLHPDYDTQFNAIPKDHFTRVKSPADFYEKMEFLDTNPQERIRLVKSLQLMLLKGVRKGEFIIDMINKHNTKNGVDIQIPYEFDETLMRKRPSKTLF
jgi:hypothetical protein